MSGFRDLRSEKFGRLTPIEYIKGYPAKWVCICDCGNRTTVNQGNLVSGSTKSCGCLNKSTLVSRSTRHGQSGTKLYNVYYHIIHRCEDRNHRAFKYYGGKGVKMCDEWRSDFMAFFNWSAKNGYKEGLSIDRIDSSGDYEPNNCRWVTATHNNRNRDFVKLTYDKAQEILKINSSKKYSQSKMAKMFGVSQSTISDIVTGKRWLEPDIEV